MQYIFIPEYEETVLFIKSAREEREREETFRLKWLKTKMTKKAAAEAVLESVDDANNSIVTEVL